MKQDCRGMYNFFKYLDLLSKLVNCRVKSKRISVKLRKKKL